MAAFFCNALPFAMFSIAQESIDSGVAGVLNATTPLWSLLIGVIIGSERGLRPARLGGLLLGFAGVVLIFAPWQATVSGGWGALAVVVAKWWRQLQRFTGRRELLPETINAVVGLVSDRMITW